MVAPGARTCLLPGHSPLVAALEGSCGVGAEGSSRVAGPLLLIRGSPWFPGQSLWRANQGRGLGFQLFFQLPGSAFLAQMAPELGCLSWTHSAFDILLASPVIVTGLTASSCRSLGSSSSFPVPEFRAPYLLLGRESTGDIYGGMDCSLLGTFTAFSVSCLSLHLPAAQPFTSQTPLLNTECPRARTMRYLSWLTGT